MTRDGPILYFSERDVDHQVRRAFRNWIATAMAVGFIYGVFVGLCFDLLIAAFGGA